jgi:4-carboxymuconolactone decarboxylase
VYGDTAERVRRGLAGLHPLLPAWTLDFAYGRVLARPALALATRELLAVSILTALGRADEALLGHMRAALRLGASRDAVAGAIAVVPPACGTGKRAAARALLPRL